MVKINFTFIFFLLATLSSLSLSFPIKPRALNELDADLRTLSNDVDKLVISLGSVNSGLDAPEELTAFLQVQNVERDLVKCNDATSGLPSLSENNAETIISIVEGIVPKVKAALIEMVAKKSYFNFLIVSGPVIYNELIVLKGSTVTLADSLILLAPLDLVGRAKVIRDQLEVEFDKAIAAYALL